MVMVIFSKTPRTAMQEALTRGDSPFSKETVDKLKSQSLQSTIESAVNIILRKERSQRIVEEKIQKEIFRVEEIQRLQKEEEEERLLEIKLKNQKIQNEIKRNEMFELLEIENQKIRNQVKSMETTRLLEIKKLNTTLSEQISLTSSLIPLGIIALMVIKK
jgi:hypothetical protein